MVGLKILDEVRWHDLWSSEIGKRLSVLDSSNDLFIFAEQHSEGELLALLEGVPKDLYQVLELDDAPEEDCDFMGDSGRCYRRLQ
jgi:hypothetical protein